MSCGCDIEIVSDLMFINWPHSQVTYGKPDSFLKKRRDKSKIVFVVNNIIPQLVLFDLNLY